MAQISVKDPGYATRGPTAERLTLCGGVLASLACLFLLLSSGAVAQPPRTQLSVGGAGSMIRAATSFCEEFEKTRRGLKVRIEPGSSRSALHSVRAGTLDIGLVGFTVAHADRVGLRIVPIRKEPILLLTNATNRVQSLSLDQIRKIYRGTITNWEEVGGENQAIVPFTRRKNSVIRQVFMQTVLGKQVTTQEKEKAFRIAKDKVLKTIKKIQGSLGFASTSLETARTSGVKVLAIDGNLPTRQNVARGSYPFTRTLFVISSERPDGVILEWINGFVKFVRNEASMHRP